ncbi:ATP-binding cassette glutathione S-conjugate transporter ycf1, partial [Coemansia biformis]
MLAHVIILLTNLDNQEMTTLRRLAAKLSFAHEIHLIRLCRLRELVLGDVWQLPARYRLASIQTEFTYNAGETLFLLRAIVRMVWRPVAPLVILASLLGMLTIVEGHLDRHIYDQLTAPSQYPWYHGILAALYRQILFTARLQHSHICNYIYNELSRAARAIKLELFRLSPTGNSQQVTQDMAWLEWEVDQLHSNLATMLNIVPTAFCAMGTFWSVYNTIGWFALVPIAIHSAIRGAKWGFELLAGPSDAWKAHTTAKYDDTIDEICHGITAIKLFHWERMHLDPKLRQTRFRKAKLPFYAPIVRVVWFIFDTAYDMSFLLSAYPMLYRYTTHRSPGDVELTSGSIYKLNMHISHLCYNAERVSTMLGDSRKAIGGSMSLERILRDKPASTLPRCNAVPVGCNPSVELSDCSFIAGKRSSTPVLKGVSLSAVSGELVAVVGATGSGKSSLLLSICGELEMTKGTGHVSGSIAYLEQSPWIMNDTVRANIVFGRDYNADLFDKIVHACALTDDIARWPSADLTVVSERGINISGGQRARLALARTIYSRADIYVLDDPLSAVDAHVRRHILNHVLLDSGMLAGKLRIVAANTGHIIPYAQKIVTLED